MSAGNDRLWSAAAGCREWREVGLHGHSLQQFDWLILPEPDNLRSANW